MLFHSAVSLVSSSLLSHVSSQHYIYLLWYSLEMKEAKWEKRNFTSVLKTKINLFKSYSLCKIKSEESIKMLHLWPVATVRYERVVCEVVPSCDEQSPHHLSCGLTLNIVTSPHISLLCDTSQYQSSPVNEVSSVNKVKLLYYQGKIQIKVKSSKTESNHHNPVLFDIELFNHIFLFQLILKTQTNDYVVIGKLSISIFAKHFFFSFWYVE